MTSNGKRCLFSVLVTLGLALAVAASLRIAPEQYPEHHPGVEDWQQPGIVGATPRSSKWPAVARAYKVGHPVCEACGAKTDLEVHHVLPFHDSPEDELNPANLITLCRSDHLKFGHRCDDGHTNWKCGNPNVREDAAKELLRRYGPK